VEAGAIHGERYESYKMLLNELQEREKRRYS
jgi:putative ribosome biogenesis GTPase RsgA